MDEGLLLLLPVPNLPDSGQEVIDVVCPLDSTRGYVGIYRALALLPPLSPEPGLISRDRNVWAQLDDALTRHDLELNTGLVQMELVTNVRR